MKTTLHYRFTFIGMMLIIQMNCLMGQAFQWAKRPSVNLAEVIDLKTDSAGNSYVIGEFVGTATFGSFSITASGGFGTHNIFIVKYDKNGTCLWAKRCGSKAGALAGGIDLDNANNVYVTGLIRDTSVVADTTLIPVLVNERAFLAKLDKNGHLIWANQLDLGGMYSHGRDIAVTPDGSIIYMVGNINAYFIYYPAGSVDPDTVWTGATDVMVTQWSASGGLNWVRHGGAYYSVGVPDDLGMAVDCNASGVAFVSGYVFGSGAVRFNNPYPVPDLDYSPTGVWCAFVATYPVSGILGTGSVIFLQSDGYSVGNDIHANSDGSYYLTGVFYSTMHIETDSIISKGGFDAFLFKGPPVSSGNFIKHVWGLYGDGYVLGSNSGPRVTSSDDGDIFWALDVSDTAHFDGITRYPGSFGYSDSYAAKLNSAGVYQWVAAAGNPGYSDNSSGVGIDANENVYIAGKSAYGIVNFTGITLDFSTGFDIWLAKLNDKLHTGPVTASLCTGAKINVTFSSDITMNTGNKYTAQLSNSSGSFNTPVNIGTKTTAATSGIIAVTIPVSTLDGTGYRIRVISSNPALSGLNNGTNISISTLAVPAVTPAGPEDVCSTLLVTMTTSTCSGCAYQWYKGSVPLAGATSTSFTSGVTGNFKTTVTNSYGCSKFSNVVKLNLVPPATISPSGTVDLCPSGSVVLTASSGAGYSYLWKKNNITIPGATSVSYTATVTGSYKVTLTHPTGCTRQSSGVTVVSSCREQNETVSENVIPSIYPNPVSDILYVEPGTCNELFISGADGRVIKQIKIGHSKTEIMTTDFAPGIYFVTLISSTNENYNYKLVKN